MEYGDQEGTNRPSGMSRLVTESVTAGLAYAMLLWWLSVCALASFRPRSLSSPYWRHLDGLRSDTSGVLAFVVAAICLTASEYLRLRRRANDPAQTSFRLVDRPAILLSVAGAKTVAVLGTGLVVYISTNAITHPETLLLRATHLVPWPTEGTLRVLALIGCAVSVAILRYLPARSSRRQHRHRSATDISNAALDVQRADEVTGDDCVAVSPDSACPGSLGQ